MDQIIYERSIVDAPNIEVEKISMSKLAGHRIVATWSA